MAIASGDVDEDYYLLKVSGNGPEVLSRSTKDDWGAKYKAGVDVFRARAPSLGHFGGAKWILSPSVSLEEAHSSFSGLKVQVLKLLIISHRR